MKSPRLRNAPASIAVALVVSAMAVPSYSAIISTGNNQHFDQPPSPSFMSVGVSGVGSLTVNGGTVLDQTNPSFGASGGVFIGVLGIGGPPGNGTGVVTGTGSTWIVGTAPNTPTGNFVVGDTAAGRLTIDLGGAVLGTNFLIGYNLAATGTATIDGVGSRGQFTTQTVVGAFGAGTLNVTHGGVLTASELFLAQSTSATGTVTISGAGSRIDATQLGGRVVVGDLGHATLNINQGGAIFGPTLVVGNTSTGNGVVNIDGVGSRAQLQLSASVGSSGTGALNVSNGGLLTGTQLIVGSAAANGTVTIDGAGSRIETTGLSLVGPNGTGSLSITNGGQFVSTFVSANQSALTLGSNSGGNGTITVSGAGSKIAGRGIITVGLNAGPNTVGNLNILNGGVVEEVSLQGAFSAGSTANIQVSGAGSLLRLSSFANQATSMNIGRVGTGQLDVTAGGKVLMDPSAANAALNSVNVLNIGGSGGNAPAAAINSNGTINVSGAGSEIRLKGDFSLISVGRNGTGALNITNGGQVINENLTGVTHSTIARATGSNGRAVVDGAGSLWQAGAKLFVGTEVTTTAAGGIEAPGGGTGVLTVSNGGKVIAGSDIIIGAGGTVKGGGGTLQGNVINKGNISPGNSPGILTIVGNLTLTASGNLNIELAGANNTIPAAPQYDQIMVLDDAATTVQEGRIVVDGNVNIAFLTGFDPNVGDFFDILSGVDITQLNPLYNLPTLDAGLRWDISELVVGGGEVLRLSVVGPTTAVPEPGAFALLGIGLLGLGALRRQRG